MGVIPPWKEVSRTKRPGLRHSFRQFVHLSVQPLARMIQDEFRAKLELDVALDFSELMAGQGQGVSVAFGRRHGRGEGCQPVRIATILA